MVPAGAGPLQVPAPHRVRGRAAHLDGQDPEVQAARDGEGGVSGPHLVMEFTYNSHEWRLESSDPEIYVEFETFQLHGRRRQPRPYTLHHYKAKVTFSVSSERYREAGKFVTHHYIIGLGGSYMLHDPSQDSDDRPWLFGYTYRFQDRDEQAALLKIIIEAMASYDLVHTRPIGDVRVTIGETLQARLDDGSLLATTD